MLRGSTQKTQTECARPHPKELLSFPVAVHLLLLPLSSLFRVRLQLCPPCLLKSCDLPAGCGGHPADDHDHHFSTSTGRRVELLGGRADIPFKYSR